MQDFDRSPSGQVANLYRRRGIGDRVGFGKRPAVIVVDLTNGFTDPAYAPGSNLDGVVTSTRRLLDVARETKIPIAFTSIAYTEPASADGGLFVVKMPALKVLRSNSPAVELDVRLGRLPHEGLFTKRFASAFFGTDLNQWLSAQGVDTVIVAGATTSGCVRATAVDGLQYGFRVLVVNECVGDRASQPHEAALFDIDAKYGDVISLSSVVAHLAKLQGREVSNR